MAAGAGRGRSGLRMTTTRATSATTSARPAVTKARGNGTPASRARRTRKRPGAADAAAHGQPRARRARRTPGTTCMRNDADGPADQSSACKKRLRVGVALVALLGHGAIDDALEPPGHARRRRRLGHRHRLLRQVHRDDGDLGLRLERPAARQHLVEHDARRVEIGARDRSRRPAPARATGTRACRRRRRPGSAPRPPARCRRAPSSWRCRSRGA